MRFLHFDSELCLDRREIHPRKKKKREKAMNWYDFFDKKDQTS
jgi:hypothetical protein